MGPPGHPVAGVSTLAEVPYHRIDDPEKLRRLMAAVLMVSADIELSELLRHFIAEACSLVEARYGALGVLNPARTALDQFLTVGLSDEEERQIGPRPTGRGVLGLLITDPEPLRLDELHSHPDSYGFPPHHPPMDSFLGVPLRVRGEVYGNLYLTDKLNGEPFNEEDEAMAEALAQAAGIAIQNTRLNDTVRLVGLLDDRDRIARDLHDRVIQRIFSVGMSLQGAVRMPGPPELLGRVSKAVEALDATIDEIRTAIFELEDGTHSGGLRRSVLDLANELAPLLGSRPDVAFNGPIDSGVSQQAADHLLAVLREALTNAGKHAGATRFRVAVSVGGELRLEVADNGRGISLPAAELQGLGLSNLRHRAEKLGGTLEFHVPDGGGTLVVWSVPS
jgi:signal transduction histidine kinase